MKLSFNYATNFQSTGFGLFWIVYACEWKRKLVNSRSLCNNKWGYVTPSVVMLRDANTFLSILVVKRGCLTSGSFSITKRFAMISEYDAIGCAQRNIAYEWISWFSLSSDKELLFYAEYHRVMGPKIVAIECEGHERNLVTTSRKTEVFCGALKTLPLSLDMQALVTRRRVTTIVQLIFNRGLTNLLFKLMWRAFFVAKIFDLVFTPNPVEHSQISKRCRCITS